MCLVLNYCLAFSIVKPMKIIITAFLILLSSNLWAASVSIEGAYVRHMPPTQTVSGAFMTFKNSTDKDRAVVSVESDIAERVELHAHLHENGVMKMRQVEKIEIPAGGETALAPGGFHVMLIGLKQPLELGQMVAIKFNFDDGSSEQIQAEVKSIMDGMKLNDGDMNHKKMQTMEN
jgi:copper(I)-binding protein